RARPLAGLETRCLPKHRVSAGVPRFSRRNRVFKKTPGFEDVPRPGATNGPAPGGGAGPWSSWPRRQAFFPFLWAPSGRKNPVRSRRAWSKAVIAWVYRMAGAVVDVPAAMLATLFSRFVTAVFTAAVATGWVTSEAFIAVW